MYIHIYIYRERERDRYMHIGCIIISTTYASKVRKK